MRNPVALLFCLFLLSGCVTDAAIVKLNHIRQEKLPVLQTQLAAADLKPESPVYIRIFKEEKELEVWVRNDPTGLYQPFKTYKICKDSGTLGPKIQQGDLRSPEGFYDITEERLWPQSNYHLAMNVGYPNQYDQYYHRTGNLLMIHGGCKSEGCFAMTDAGIEEIYILTEASLKANAEVPVHIFPFRMTDANMAMHKGTQWTPFWTNLKQGYDWFEQNHFPPRVVAHGGQYLFAPQVFVFAQAGEF